VLSRADVLPPGSLPVQKIVIGYLMPQERLPKFRNNATTRKLVIGGSLFLICAIVLGLLPIWGNVQIIAPMLSIPVAITRNGQEVAPTQIQSVRYLVGVNPPDSPEDISDRSLRDANLISGANFYLIAASFSIYRYGSVSPSTEVKPDFRSVFLRVTFTDGKAFSLSFPVVADSRLNMPMYIDFSDAPR
jgi:hypothetical protein